MFQRAVIGFDMVNALVWLLKCMFTDILDKIIIFTTFMDKIGSKMQKKSSILSQMQRLNF